MAKPKRTKLQREDDLVKLLALMRRGVSQGSAARTIGLSKQQISYDWLELLARLRDEKSPVTEEIRLVKQAEYDDLKVLLRDGWERSQQPAEVVLVKTKEMPGAATGNAPGFPVKRSEATKRTENQAGDPRFVAELIKIIEGERRMWGLDAPVKVAPTTPDGMEPYSGTLNVDEAAAVVRDIAARLGVELPPESEPVELGAAGGAASPA